MVNSLKQFNIVIRESPMFENLPNPLLLDTGEGSVVIISGYDGDIRGVPVGAFRMVTHGVNSASRIQIQEVVEKVPPSNKTILTPVSDLLILRLQRFNIGRHNKLVVSVLEGEGAGLEGLTDDFNRIMGLGTLRNKNGRTLIKFRGR